MSNGGDVQVPDGWKRVKLSDVAEVDPDSLKQNTDPDYEFRYVDISSVSTGNINIPTSKIRFSVSPSRARRIVRSNDVLMATVRPNLKAFAHYSGNEKDIICSTGFAVIRSKANSDSRYIYNTILSENITGQIENLIVGSNYPAINSSDVKTLFFPLPPLSEQKKIASILTSVDDVIEKTEAQISKLQDLKKGMMTELLTKGIGHTEFKDSPVGRIPVGWEVKTVKNLLKQRKKKGTESYPIYSVLIEGGMVPRDTIDRRLLSDLHESENLTAIKGDLVYNMMRMWQGASGIAPANCLVSPAYVVAEPFEGVIDSGFLGYLMKSSYAIVLLHRYSYGLTGDRLRLYFDSFGKIKFAIPPIAEQKEIAQVLSAIDVRIVKKSKKLLQTKALKKALMNDLLTGKKRVQINN
ncbi:MAG: restriction endonuclease subunit S [Proteobacteria bacterium]|nr:restriction endonuclease subunit S [Pseudomonadota bacterium]